MIERLERVNKKQRERGREEKERRKLRSEKAHPQRDLIWTWRCDSLAKFYINYSDCELKFQLLDSITMFG